MGYFYGFKSRDLTHDRTFYELSAAYPELSKYYGFLVGIFYTVPFAIGGLFAGDLTRTLNRKITFLTVISVMSLLTIGVGTIDSFLLFAVIRMVNGLLSSAVNPFAFSLVADYFPAEKRTTANSIVSSANQAGIALSSLSILFISRFGWRTTYVIMGVMGLLGCLLLTPFKNPKR